MDAALIVINIIWGLAMAACGFVIRRIISEFDTQRAQIATLERMNTEVRVAAAQLGEKLATEYVRSDAIADIKFEMRERYDKIDARLEKIWEEMRRLATGAAR